MGKVHRRHRQRYNPHSTGVPLATIPISKLANTICINVLFIVALSIAATEPSPVHHLHASQSQLGYRRFQVHLSIIILLCGCTMLALSALLLHTVVIITSVIVLIDRIAIDVSGIGPILLSLVRRGCFDTPSGCSRRYRTGTSPSICPSSRQNIPASLAGYLRDNAHPLHLATLRIL